MAKITINQIAEELNLSRNTISKVLIRRVEFQKRQNSLY